MRSILFSVIILLAIYSSFYCVASFSEFNRELDIDISHKSRELHEDILLNLFDTKESEMISEVSNNDLIDHDPILISSNDDFAGQANIEGWFGSGTLVEPYIIEKLRIRGGSFQIRIEHTNVYFVIRNCVLLDGTDQCIYLVNVTNGMIKSTTILRVMDNSVFLSSCSSINISKCNFVRSEMGGNGVAMHSSTNIGILDNYFEFTGIYISSSSKNSFVMHNIVTGAYTGIAIDGGSSNISVLANEFFNSSVCGIWLQSSSSIQILENTVRNNSQGILLDSGSRFSLIEENLISYQEDFGIRIAGDQATNNSVLANELCFNKLGFFINAPFNTFMDNIVFNNSNQGFYIGGENYLSNNLVFCNGGIGIHLSGGFRAIVRENLIYNNSLGVGVFESDYCRIWDNTIARNNGNGIQFDSFNGTVVNNSMIQNRLFGIEARGRGLSIFHNNFVSNNNGGIQASNPSATDNQWDTGVEGNYWDDWVMPDNDSDGIVDFPYVLEGEGAIYDYYPLVRPRPVPWRGLINLVPPLDTILLPSSPINVTIIYYFQPNIYFSWDNLSFQKLPLSDILLAPEVDGQYELVLKIEDIFGFNSTKIYSFSIDGSPPSITSLNDVIITQGLEEYINWTLIDQNPKNFTLFQNDELISFGEWTSGDSIYYPLNGLSLGYYNFTILVTDVAGNRMKDEIHVTVIPFTTPTLTTPKSSTTPPSSTSSLPTVQSPSFSLICVLSLIIFIITRKKS